MKYTVDKQDKYSIISLHETNLNSILAPDLKAKLIVFRNEGTPNLILDLSNVKFADSSGLSAILTGHRLWKDFGSFVLTGISNEGNKIKDLMKISRLEPVFNIIPSVQESKDFIMMEVIEREIIGEDDENVNNIGKDDD